jgi:hypothetical protein
MKVIMGRIPLLQSASGMLVPTRSCNSRNVALFWRLLAGGEQSGLFQLRLTDNRISSRAKKCHAGGEQSGLFQLSLADVRISSRAKKCHFIQALLG